jgi:hypothetical protein
LTVGKTFIFKIDELQLFEDPDVGDKLDIEAYLD